LAIVSDISDRLRLEQEREQLLLNERAARAEAERANRLKDDFLATLSHELRTPLNAIVGWSQLLRMGQLDPGEAEEGLDAIERNARAQAQMIADLLDVSRITSGKIRLEVELLNPAELIDAALSAVSPAAEAKSIRVTRELDPNAGPISGDPSRLQQVIWNLVNNAVKFTPKDGRVEVALRRLDSHVEIRVSDNGQGINPALLPSIFERFSQGDASSKREHAGLGLGLAIAKQLVEMHGGTISAESAGEGKGATFIVKLPLTPAHKPAANATDQVKVGAAAPVDSTARQAEQEDNSQAADPVDLTGIRVLVVEDDADSRALLRRILTGCGAETLEASSVSQALSAIANFNPHLLISDLGMPGEDGFDLIRAVRDRGYSPQEMPAVALTALARTQDRSRALSAGFQMHMSKPVDARELTMVIGSLMGRIPGRV
jgi:nitrogen-specific signal transduction histidine kinase/CheY-like chemotaxis protein